METRIEAWMRVFDERGIPADRAQVARLIGADGKRLVRDVAAAADLTVEGHDQEEIDKRSGEIYDELNTDPRLVRGSRPLLLALGASALPWAIATSSRKEQVTASVEALRLPHRPRIVDGSHVEHAKPAPDLLLLAARQLHVAPEKCWYVGDSTWDMEASRAAGMVGVGIAAGAVGRDDLADAGATTVTTFGTLLGDLRRRSLVPARS